MKTSATRGADPEALISLRQRYAARYVAGATRKGLAAWVRVYDDRIEYQKPEVIARGTTETLRYEQVAQVIVRRGALYSELAVQSNGGGGFLINSLNKDEADAAKRLIDERVALIGDQQVFDSTPESPSLASEITRLAALKESGALSDEEFAVAKTRLISGDDGQGSGK
jgi:hypothetical protein